MVAFYSQLIAMTLLFTAVVGSVDCESPVSFRPPPPVGIEVEPRGGSNHIRLILRLVTRQRLQHSLSNSSLCRQPRVVNEHTEHRNDVVHMFGQ